MLMLQVRDHVLLERRVEVEQQPFLYHVYYLEQKTLEEEKEEENLLPGTVNIALSAWMDFSAN